MRWVFLRWLEVCPFLLQSGIGSTTPYDAWWKLAVSQLGIPGALMVAICFAFWKGWIVPGWAVTREREYTAREREITIQKDKENDELKEELKEERKRFRDLLLQHRDMTARAVDATVTAAKAVTPAGSQ